MPTDDKRREASAGLRRLAEKHDGVAWFLIAKHLGLVDDEAFLAGPIYTSNSVSRLADLIEPEAERTCHPVPMDWVGNPPYYNGGVQLNSPTTGCSESGYPWKVSITRTPNYCPNCGARVVG